MNIEIKDNRVWIEADDIGWHDAGSIEDVIANYPELKEQINQLQGE